MDIFRARLVGNPAAWLFGYFLKLTFKQGLWATPHQRFLDTFLSRAVAKLLGRTLIFACLDKIQASGVSCITGSRDSAAGFLPNLAAADGLAWAAWQMCNSLTGISCRWPTSSVPNSFGWLKDYVWGPRAGTILNRCGLYTDAVRLAGNAFHFGSVAVFIASGTARFVLRVA